MAAKQNVMEALELESLLDQIQKEESSFSTSVVPRWERKQKKEASFSSSSAVAVVAEEREEQRQQESEEEQHGGGGAAAATTGIVAGSNKNPPPRHCCENNFPAGGGTIITPGPAATSTSSSCTSNFSSAATVVTTTSSSIARSAAGGSSVSSSPTRRDDQEAARVLAFTKRPPNPDYYGDDRFNNNSHSSLRAAAPPGTHAKARSVIDNATTLVLDAPGMSNNFYFNNISWGSNNMLAVALGKAVYLWDCSSRRDKNDVSTTAVVELIRLPDDDDDCITSVAWMGDPYQMSNSAKSSQNMIAIGTSKKAFVQIWDAGRGTQVRTMDGHSAQVGSLAWSGPVLASGSRDTTVINHDVRVKEHHFATMKGHSLEVCGLAWSPDGLTLASGSNDNNVCIWDSAMSGAAASCSSFSGVSGTSSSGGGTPPAVVEPRMTLIGHTAAVKALAWSRCERNLLATGGGNGDNTIKLWNTGVVKSSSGALQHSVNTGSQVTSLLWTKSSSNSHELLSGHGYSANQLTLWHWTNYSMVRMTDFKGHTGRVLNLAAAPDNFSSVVSAGADETIRFWDDVFSSSPEDQLALQQQLEDQDPAVRRRRCALRAMR